eukprot:3687120-Karenia_brevis.AAC.1
MSIRFSFKGSMYKVIAVYGPTYQTDVDDKDAFYDGVRRDILETSQQDVLLILGDWNARVGVRDDTWGTVLGSFGNTERNDNGVRLLELCTATGLRIMNT